MSDSKTGHIYRGATIAWGGGRCYDFENPNPGIITLEDIAYALAFTPRWRGQTRHRGARCFFGVAQHCEFGARRLIDEGFDADTAFEFLTHEFDEVVLPDMPGPVKNLLPGFRDLARRQSDGLTRVHGVELSDPDLIKHWDNRMMITEKRDLMPGHGPDTFHTSDRRSISEIENPPFLTEIVPYAHPEVAAIKWLELYWDLTRDR